MMDLVVDRLPPAPSDMRGHLRAATREQHRALDARLARYALSVPDQYAAFLRIHWKALQELQYLWRSEDDAEFAHLLFTLEGDLKCVVTRHSKIPPMRPSEFTAAKGVGVSYVIRGSRLGAALLRSKVPDGFSTGYLDSTLRLSWPEFLAQLEKFERSAGPTDFGEATAAAIRTFGVFTKIVEDQQGRY